MESEIPTEWSVALEQDIVRDNIPVCSSLWSVSAPDLWSAPELLEAPATEQAALLTGPDASTNMVSSETEDQEVQTEDWTEEKGSNTNDDWESVMHSVDEYSTVLAKQFESLVKQDSAEQTEHELLLESLRKTRDEKIRQHQSLLGKIGNVHEKLELNSSKITRKNFMAKVEELTAEKERLLEAKKKLVQDLEDADRKLKQLIEEQNNERLTWEQEISELQAERERLSKQVEETCQITLNDEIAALESQRQMAITLVEDWIAEAERYLGTLRLDPSPQQAQQRLEWEKNVVMVRSSLTRLQNMYNENLSLLQNGQPLETLPTVFLPSLPNVPTIDLFMSPLRNSVQMQYYGSPASLPEFHLAGASTHRVTPPLSTVSSQNLSTRTRTSTSHTASGPTPHLTMPTALPPQHFRMPTGPTGPLPHPSAHTHTITPASTYSTTGPTQASMATTPVTVPKTTSHTAAVRPLPVTANPSPLTVMSNPPPAGKLDKLLERLGAQFPQSTRTQLMGVLQQIKSERGTMAGLSMDEVIQQVSQRLAQSERPAPGLIAPPPGSRLYSGPQGPAQRLSVQSQFRHPNSPVFQPRPPQAPLVRKLCLMCQNHVEPGTQYNTNCTHTLHKECISVWLKSSKDHSCPFCPSK
ncbi:RING finger protein 214 [Hoplias malabaricus]|uniref:RING finger protein 214 n=1 Tax=Hoplias malabaricus TaxID=27720 RepID=UPI0034637291